jgi:DNA-binding winged helix-turn-helix (wHTH) protein/tetratricopeptide (TPR) repeat protein
MSHAAEFHVGDWRVDGPGCRLHSEEARVSLEPKVMDLLLLLADRAGAVVSRDELLAALWPGVIVGDDTLARTVSKLRSALRDDVRNPAYIETVPKRGYRLIAPVTNPETPAPARRRSALRWMAVLAALLIVVAGLLWVVQRAGEEAPPSETELLASRADDFYMRFTQADNAAAIDLYERVIAMDPEHPGAQAGLANALVQRVIRWPDDQPGVSTVTDAISSGLNETPQARELLARAESLAQRALRHSPDNADALKALGLVYATSGRLDEARELYERAAALDADAWEPLVNLGELDQIDGDLPSAAEHLSQAYEVMQRLYDREPQKVGPWHASIGVAIGELHEEMGNPEDAEIWYRRILRLSPYEPEATARLATILAAAGDLREAVSLCRNLQAVGSAHERCDELLAGSASIP